MASSAIKGFMKFFKGGEGKKEEAAEKKLPAKQYTRGEKAEGEKPAKKSTFPVKKAAAKTTGKKAMKK